MYVYQSAEFRERAQGSTVSDRIENLIKKIEQVGRVSSNNVPYFPGRYGSRYLKHEENEFRIVAELKTIDEVQLIYLHTVFTHKKEKEYKQFIGDIDAKRFPYEIDMDAVEKYVKEQKTEENSRIKVAQATKPLPKKFVGWLSRTERNAREWVIYDGQEWVSKFSRKEYQERWELLCEIIGGIVDYADEFRLSGDTSTKTYGEVVISPVESFKGVYQANKIDRFVLFSIPQVVTRLAILLLAPFDHQPQEQEIDKLIHDTYPFLGKGSDFQVDLNDIARASSRVYPYYIPLDHTLWKEIELEEDVNLALSTEEEKILNSISTIDSADYRLPIFINGRAGSGKSTILFYIFADYCSRIFDPKNQDNLEELGLAGLPLFLTYNKELLRIAKDRVKRLLKTRLYLSDSNKNDTKKLEEIDEKLTAIMKPFREYLLELLPDDDENKKFRDPSKRITFHEFKKLYLNHFHTKDAKKYSADECWYVIRTFIKGYSLDGYLNNEQYEEIFKKDRIFPSDDFDKIFKTVWTWYADYQKKNHLWDDQDLIRAVLNSGVEPTVDYTAVFCDEAQDFTKLELHFILQTSVFAQYDLSEYNKTISLPFAFAGDPLQTLNPTGFRWAKVQSIFHQEIIEGVDPSGILDLHITPVDDLVYNYRSTEHIVETTNAIILVRNKLFNQDTKPQRHWGKGKVSFPPQKFILEKQVDLNRLKQKIQNTIIIIPCDEGGEIAYIQADKELSVLFPDVTEENRPWNVFSAIGAKGLEFKRVILYKFGEHCPSEVWAGDLTYGQKAEAEYFFNKLYVAATRAMTWLFVLESSDGERNLWDHLIEQELIRYREACEDPKSWSVRPSKDNDPAKTYTLQAISDGTEEDLDAINETNPKKNAMELEEKGKDTENPEYLRRAKRWYVSMREQEKADNCEAYALKFENKLQQSGNLFLKINNVELARECFWDGELWSEVLKLKGKIRPDEVQLAEFMESKKDDTKVILDFTAFVENGIEKNTIGKSVSKQWKSVMSEYRQRIITLQERSLSEEDWHSLGTVLEELTDRGFLDSQGATGKCYFNAKNYKKAIQIWDANGLTSSKEYNLAKAKTMSYPSNLEYLEKAGERDQIIKAWQEQGGLDKPQDPRAVRYVGPVLEEKQHYWDACQVYIKVSDPDVKKIVNLIERIKKFTPKMVENRDEVKVLINYLCAHSQWSDLLALLEKLFVIIKEPQEQTEIRCTVIQNLAQAGISGDIKDLEVVKRFYQDIIRPVRTDPHWRKYISLEEEFGPAVEILGFEMSLRFYEGFINRDKNPAEMDFARSRWLDNAKKKVDYWKEKGKEIQDRTFLMKYSQRKRDWNISSPSSTPTPLPNSSGDERKRVKDEVIKTFSPIQGLSPEIKVNNQSEGQIKFMIGSVDYTVYKAKKMVALTDQELNRVLCNFTTLQVSSGEIKVDSLDIPEGKTFSIPLWKLTGKIQKNNDKVVLELAPNELDAPFTIEL